MSIFVSSACIKERSLKDNILEFNRLGFDCVELTGGLDYALRNIDDIKNLSRQNNLNIQLHNYSPPAEYDFVLNLASLDQQTYDQSLSHVQDVLKFSVDSRLGKYAVHAGFYIPIHSNELGKLISKRELYDKETSYERFVSTVNLLYDLNEGDLYIENNVVSQANFNEYGENPFMLTCADEYFELKQRVPELRLLLDFAHLKVSCNTLGLSFEDEIMRLIDETDYVHISDNDGLSDLNKGLEKDSQMYDILKMSKLSTKVITLEIYSGIDDLRRSYQLVKELI